MSDVLGLCPLAANWKDLNWGDVPTWISAVAALLALAGLVVASKIAYNVYRIESERDRLAEEDRKDRERDALRQQAMKVATWYGFYRDSVTGSRFLGALVKNASDLPIYDVEISFHFVSERPNGDWSSVRRGGPEKSIRVIPPGEVHTEPLPNEISRQVTGAGAESYVVSIQFRDAAGRRWERDTHGRLLEA